MQAPDGELDTWLAAMPRAPRLPFEVAPRGLYDICELYAGFDPARPESLATVFDTRAYRWTRKGGGKSRGHFRPARRSRRGCTTPPWTAMWPDSSIRKIRSRSASWAATM